MVNRDIESGNLSVQHSIKAELAVITVSTEVFSAQDNGDKSMILLKATKAGTRFNHTTARVGSSLGQNRALKFRRRDRGV